MKKIILSLAAASLMVSALSIAQANAYSGIDEEGTIHVISGDVTPLDITVTITGEEEVYDSASLDRKTGVSLSPQTVRATGLDNAFFKIHTWLGEKWIFPKNKIIYNLEPFQQELLLPTVTPIFDFPNGNEHRAGELNPQTVTSFERAAGGWYHIQTWLGDQWINPAIALPKDLEKSNRTLDLVLDTAVLQYPSKHAKVMGTIRPQAVTSYEQTKTGWYHIRSSVGDGWIEVDQSHLPQKVDEVIQLDKETALYSSPVGGWLAKLSPQPVKAHLKWNNWYRIHTWLGDAWIIVDPRN